MLRAACCVRDILSTSEALRKTAKDVRRAVHHQQMGGSAQGEVVGGSACGAACREISLAACNPKLELVWRTPRPAALIPFLRRLRSLGQLVFHSSLSLTLCAVRFSLSCSLLPRPSLDPSAPATHFTASHTASHSRTHQTWYHLMHAPARFAR
jgi:hypothetical protein